MTPEGYRIERGLLWPATDVGGPAVMQASASVLDAVYQHCESFDVAVQAGGHCGVWPDALGRKFAHVYTFEPDPMNFRCLCANAPAENVFKFNAALDVLVGGIEMIRRPDNTGANCIGGAGPIPSLRLDALGLSACDLICLDVEGYEMASLKGAEATIEAHRPVIVIEDKGCSERYGIAIGETPAVAASA